MVGRAWKMYKPVPTRKWRDAVLECAEDLMNRKSALQGCAG
jgi:hypothetical protein